VVRPDLEKDEIGATLLAVGRRVAELRRTRGRTQEQLATALDVATKYFQRIERGTQNLTLSTLVKLARVLAVPVESLLEPPRELGIRVGRPPKRWHATSPQAPIRITTEPGPGRVPLLSLEVAAGSLGHLSDAQVAGWLDLGARRRARRGMFVAKTLGASMSPLIHDGAYCLFEGPAEASGQGEVLLVQHSDVHDPDTGLSYTVKRVFLAEKREGRRRRRLARLVSINREYPPIEIELGRDERLRIIARFIDMV
jgi:transcriptional regulator with XRE-family HTH domain